MRLLVFLSLLGLASSFHGKWFHYTIKPKCANNETLDYLEVRLWEMDSFFSDPDELARNQHCNEGCALHAYLDGDEVFDKTYDYELRLKFWGYCSGKQFGCMAEFERFWMVADGTSETLEVTFVSQGSDFQIQTSGFDTHSRSC